jgi:hypothetical protein
MNGSPVQAKGDSTATSIKIVAAVFTSLPEYLPTEPTVVVEKIINMRLT